MADKSGLTPGGYRDPSTIHRVAPGQYIHRSDTGHEIRDRASGQVVKTIPGHPQPAEPPEPPRAEETEARAKATFKNGWQAYTAWTNSSKTPISRLQASWVVPQPPTTKSNQTLFLFPGIENTSGSVGILQPVLQWGVSYIGGGAYWSATSWYVSSTGDAYYADRLVRVSAGQKLTGVINLSDALTNPKSYAYNCAFQGIAGSVLEVADLPQLTYAVMALEAYEITDRTQYPPDDATLYQAIDLKAAVGLTKVPWKSYTPSGAFGVSVKVISNAVPGGSVQITY